MESVDSKEISETLTGTETGDETDAKKWIEDLKQCFGGKQETDSDRYNMAHPKRGKAVIFNHMTFTNKTHETREGTEKDEAKLKKCFLSLGFEVDVHRDLKLIQLFNVLDELREEDHSKRDCLVMVVMSHGEHDKIFCSDSDYRPENLWNPFTADNCPTLAGKPKLFFIQACRGKLLDSGTKLSGTQTDSSSYEVPDESPNVVTSKADFLIVFSTAPGYYSFRNRQEGSWFIQTLTTVLTEHKDQKNLLSMMTIMARRVRVALDFESYVPKHATFDKKKQVPMISSTLTRDIWL